MLNAVKIQEGRYARFGWPMGVTANYIQGNVTCRYIKFWQSLWQEREMLAGVKFPNDYVKGGGRFNN